MTKQELIKKLSEVLEISQGKGSRTRYIFFNPFKKEFIVKYNSDVVRNLEEVSHYIGRALNSEMDYEKIVAQINKQCKNKFGIKIITDEQITKKYNDK